MEGLEFVFGGKFELEIYIRGGLIFMEWGLKEKIYWGIFGKDWT